ncbi:hypothetical protein Agub_g1872, partial [Astrephomene gubernaculifera]
AASGGHPGQGLTHSTWGSAEGALRPFVSVLRLSDDANVRAMALAAVAGAMTTHARGLGAGWRVAMEALRRAAEDPAPAVYEQAMGAMEVAVAALFRTPAAVTMTAAVAATQPPGHDCYAETLRAVLTAIRNPHHPDRAPSVVQVLVRCGERLAQRPPLPPPAASSAAGAGHMSGYASPYSSRHRQLAPQQSWSQTQQPSADPSAPLSPHQTNTSAGAAAGSGTGSLLDQLALSYASSSRPSSLDEWALLVEVVADVAATRNAPRLAAAGLEAALDLMRTHSGLWGPAAWRVMLRKVVAAVAFRVPPALDPASYPAEAAAAAAAGLPHESICAGFVARVDRLFPLMCAQLAPLAAAAAAADEEQSRNGGRRRRHPRRATYDSSSDEDAGDDGEYGSGPPPDLHRELLTLLAETCLGWFRHPAEAVARAGLSSLSRLLDATGGVVLAGGSTAAAATAAVPSRAAATATAVDEDPAVLRGWEVLLPLISSTVDAELTRVTDFTERLRRQQCSAAAPSAAAAAAPAAASPVTAPAVPAPAVSAPFSGAAGKAAQHSLEPDVRSLRCRCRMLVLLQRLLAEFAARHVAALPWRVTRQLVGVLAGAARRLMAFNMREELPEQGQQKEEEEEARAGAAAEAAEAAAAGDGEEPSGRSTGDGWGDGWDEDEWDEDGAEQQDAAGPRSSEAAAPRRRRASGAGGSGKGDGRASGRSSSTLSRAPASTAAVATTAASPSPGGGALAGARLQLAAPQLQLTAATAHDSMRPALARLEVEAADAAMTL